MRRSYFLSFFSAALFWATSPSAQTGAPVADISAIADGSGCRSALDGALSSYVRGVAIVFARAACEPDRDVKIVSAARSDAQKTDALSWYEPQFAALMMPNERAAADTLRHTYALLLGLGVRESSGRYCVGRDSTADFEDAGTAEAGLFQTSWGVHKSSSVLEPMFRRYSADPRNCLLDIFRPGARCSRWDARTWGEGTGADWQKLTKACPAFATEYAAVVLRSSGGSRGEFGPIRSKAAQLTKACDAMLSKVQAYLTANSQACAALQ